MLSLGGGMLHAAYMLIVLLTIVGAQNTFAQNRAVPNVAESPDRKDRQEVWWDIFAGTNLLSFFL